MPPITLWATLAVCTAFALVFTGAVVVGVLERRRAARAAHPPPRLLRAVVVPALLAAICWFAVYRVFRPG